MLWVFNYTAEANLIKCVRLLHADNVLLLACRLNILQVWLINLENIVVRCDDQRCSRCSWICCPLLVSKRNFFLVERLLIQDLLETYSTQSLYHYLYY